MSDDALAAILSSSQPKYYQAKEYIFFESASGEAGYLVVTGRVAVVDAFLSKQSARRSTDPESAFGNKRDLILQSFRPNLFNYGVMNGRKHINIAYDADKLIISWINDRQGANLVSEH